MTSCFGGSDRTVDLTTTTESEGTVALIAPRSKDEPDDDEDDDNDDEEDEDNEMSAGSFNCCLDLLFPLPPF